MLNSDLPIEKSKDDALNRSSFAESLAKVMLTHTVPEGFVIGMYGKWGYGKTSVINMVLESVEILSISSLQKHVVLRFNPWMCSDSKQLISQFFKQLSSAIKMKQLNLDKVCNFMNDYADAFDLAGALPIAGNILSAVGKVLRKKAKSYTEEKNNDLQKIKNEIIATLNKEKIKIIVTIDDIDRLTNTEIVSVFQLVKSLADFPYTIYLLAFDREVVIKALSEVQKGDGAEYLEKVIQVPFELPTPNQHDIYQIFFNKCDSIMDIHEDKWDKEYWSEMFHHGIKQYLHSIRDVVRFTNTFALKYALLKNETNIIDLLGLTCLQVFEPIVYSRLSIQKEALCGGSSHYEYNQRQKEDEKIQNAYKYLFSDISDEKSENCKNILVKLFPKLNSTFYRSFGLGFGYNRHYDHYQMINNGNIANPDCFDRYFALALEKSAISQSEVDHLLFYASRAEMVSNISRINLEGKTTRLLDHIRASFEPKKGMQEYADRAELILECMLLSCHTLKDDQETKFLSMPFDWRLMFSAEALMRVLHEADRYSKLSALFSDINVDVSTILLFLRNFERQHNRFIGEEKVQQEQLITFKEVVELEKIFIERVMVELNAGTLLDSNSAIDILWLWEQLDEAAVKTNINKMIGSDLSLAKLVSASVSHGNVINRTVYKTWRVRKDDIKKYIDIDITYNRMLLFVHTNEFGELSDDKKENIAAFLIDIENPSISSPFNGCIVLATIEKKLQEIDGIGR